MFARYTGPVDYAARNIPVESLGIFATRNSPVGNMRASLKIAVQIENPRARIFFLSASLQERAMHRDE